MRTSDRVLRVTVPTPKGDVIVSARYVEKDGQQFLQITAGGSHAVRELVRPYVRKEAR